MKSHTKIYLKSFGYTDTDFIPCEVGGLQATDVHHIFCKGMGGNPSGDKDRIENLMALTRENHEKYGDKKQYLRDLLFIHEAKLKAKGIDYDKDWFIEAYKKCA